MKPVESNDPSVEVQTDPDLQEQARPGHGIPSQDPDPCAQFPVSKEDAEREAKSVFVGGGVIAGAATGAAAGAVVAGPVGVLVGGTIGAVTGALGGAAAGAAMPQVDDDTLQARKSGLDT